MSPSVDRDDAGLCGILTIGGILSLSHVIHVIYTEQNVATVLFGVVVPFVLSLVVVGGGTWMARADPEWVDPPRVGSWCVVGMLVLVVGAVLLIPYQRAHGTELAEPVFVVVGAASFGAPMGLLIGLYDSRRTAALDTMAAARDRSDHLNRRLSVVNRVLRHDIRNDTNVIQMRTDLLEEGVGETAEHLTAIRERSERMVELGERMRKLGRLADGDAERAPVDIVGLLERNLARTREEHPAVETTLTGPDEATVSAHPLVDSAVAHLLENAVQYTDKPTTRLDVCVSTADDDVVVTITDNGPGIPEEDLAVLERGHETPLEHTDGLGLWLVEWVMRASAGSVEFDCADDGGCVVVLQFEPGSPSTDGASPP